MDKHKDVPLIYGDMSEDAIEVVGLDGWGTAFTVDRQDPFWLEADMQGVVEPSMLLKDKLGLHNPALRDRQDEIQEALVQFFNTEYVSGDEEHYLRKLAGTLRKLGIHITVTRAAVKRLKQITTQERKDFMIFPDVPKALDKWLAQGKKLALLSNNSQFNSEWYLRHTVLCQYFDNDNSFWSYKLGVSKPDPRYFITVLELLGIKPEKFLFIDDQPDNLIVARELGIKVLRIERKDRELTTSVPAAAADIPVIRLLSEPGKRLG